MRVAQPLTPIDGRRLDSAEQRLTAPPISWGLAAAGGALLAVLSVAQISGSFVLGPYGGRGEQSWIYSVLYTLAGPICFVAGGELVDRGHARPLLLGVVGTALVWFTGLVVFPPGAPMGRLAWTAAHAGLSLAGLVLTFTLIRTVAVVRSEHMAVALSAVTAIVLLVVRMPVEGGVHVVASIHNDPTASLMLGFGLLVVGALAWWIMGHEELVLQGLPITSATEQRWRPLVPVAGGLLIGGLDLTLLRALIDIENVALTNQLLSASGLMGLAVVLVLGIFCSARRIAIGLLVLLLTLGIGAITVEPIDPRLGLLVLNGCWSGLHVVGKVWVVVSLGWNRIGRNLAVFLTASLAPHSLLAALELVDVVDISTRQMALTGICISFVSALCLFAATRNKSRETSTA